MSGQIAPPAEEFFNFTLILLFFVHILVPETNSGTRISSLRYREIVTKRVLRYREVVNIAPTPVHEPGPNTDGGGGRGRRRTGSCASAPPGRACAPGAQPLALTTRVPRAQPLPISVSHLQNAVVLFSVLFIGAATYLFWRLEQSIGVRTVCAATSRVRRSPRGHSRARAPRRRQWRR